MATVETINRTRRNIDMDALASYADTVLNATRDFKNAEISITMVGDKRMQDLNTKWRNKNYPTDVLSFPIDDEEPGEGPLLLGDIVIAPRQALADAEEENVTFEEKLRELILHSILHLIGFDHETPEDAMKMDRRRVALLKKIGDSQ